MEILREDDQLERDTCLSLGNFDGLHVAHRKLIERALDAARKRDMACAVLTFAPHPRQFFFGRGPERILPHHIKDKILEDMGVDYLIVLPFDQATASMEPEAFVRMLVERYRAKHLFVGYNYHFGDKQKGSTYLLAELKERYGYELTVQNEVRKENRTVSSTAIRDMIREGRVDTAGALLGYCPMVEGTVVQGNRLGTELGFPTANLQLAEDLLVPKDGVYVGYVKALGSIHKALINVGRKPTVGEGFERNIEAYLLDFEGNLYGERIQVSFTGRLRDEVRFDSLDALIKQMQEDERYARAQHASGTRANKIALFPDSLY